MLTNKHANLAIQRRQRVLTAWLSWIHALLPYHIQPRYFFSMVFLLCGVSNITPDAVGY
jgi:hypothetical protein